MPRATLSNGTRISVRGGRTVVILPGGKVARACPQTTPEEARIGQAQTAADLGYGEDAEAMVADHDPLHALLCDWLGLPTSIALSGGDEVLARHEEVAVLAIQRFMRLAGGRLPL